MIYSKATVLLIMVVALLGCTSSVNQNVPDDNQALPAKALIPDENMPAKALIGSATDLRGMIFSIKDMTPNNVSKRVDDLIRRGVDLYEAQLIRSLSLGTDEKKLSYINRVRGEIAESLSTELQLALADGPSARGDDIDVWKASEHAAMLAFQTKGRLQDAMTTSMAGLRQHLTEKNKPLLEELSRLRKLIATLSYKGAAMNDPELVKLIQDTDRIQEKLGKESQEFMLQTGPVTLEKIKKALHANEVLVDFEVVPAEHISITGDGAVERDLYGQNVYYSILVSSTSEKPIVRFIESAQEVDLKISNLRQSFMDSRNSEKAENAARELGKIMERTLQGIGKKDTLIISPDSLLNLVPFGAIIDPETGKYLVEKYTISYVTSPRDLLRFNVKQASKGEPVIIGNPDYYAGTINHTADNSASNSTGLRSIDFTSTDVPPLPGTGVEATAIARIVDGQLSTGSQATETFVKQVRGPVTSHSIQGDSSRPI